MVIKKTGLIFLFCMQIYHAMGANDPAPLSGITDFRYKPALGLIASGLSITTGKKIKNTELFQRLCAKAGVSHHDISNLIGLSGSLIAAASNANPEMQEGLRRFGTRAPVAALVTWLVTRKTFREIIKDWPLVGPFFNCPNSDCTGFCKDCRLTSGALLIGTYVLIDILLSQLKLKTGWDL